MDTQTHFSPCGRYRYALSRIWEAGKPSVMVIGLNPSLTDDNPTITRCTNFAKSWGFGGVHVTNLFAFRAATPDELIVAPAPVGDENDNWLTHLAKSSKLTVAAWGNYGSHKGRSEEVKRLLPDLHCIRMNKSGEPAHPLYLKASLMPVKLPVQA
ncbi:MAG: DUF1643 domain-containing protein [Marinobacter sp.]|uniref:DUF1643 domain-containing protein n=1 Tax=unclassified Marinobacter TaxID=83889 RepID=UPI00273CB4EE|nr:MULTISPECIES: DUF1643 domain-containing protein [unclassified Marinobacter]MDP4547437.1 DUF1643 domain-containing protein [Marinobacter sp. MDS2]